jgi:Trk-type K+ transport system membrane component
VLSTLASWCGLAHLALITIIDRQRIYMRVQLSSLYSFTTAIARSAACSALASPAVAGVQAPRKHAAAVVVNLQQLKGSSLETAAAASAKHALSIESAVVVRVTSPFTIPSSAIASHVVMPFLLLPPCE